MNQARASLSAATLTVMLLLSIGSVARAQPSHGPSYYPPPPQRLERPRPFGQGAVNVGGMLGFGSSGKSVAFTLGVNLGYFVLDGLEPGIFSDVTFGSEIDTQVSVLPYLRYIFYRSWSFSPFIKAQGGGLFFIDGPKLGLVGGGGGFVWGLGGNLGLNIEGMVFKLLPESECPPDDDCVRYSFGISLSYLIGARSSRARHRRPLPPSPPRRPQETAPPPPSAASPPSPPPPADEPGAPAEETPTPTK